MTGTARELIRVSKDDVVGVKGLVVVVGGKETNGGPPCFETRVIGGPGCGGNQS